MEFIDLFSGAGGLSCGIKNAGGNLVFATDFDLNAAKTYRYNMNHWKNNSGFFIEAPIEKLHKSLLNKKINNEYQSKMVVEHSNYLIQKSKYKDFEIDESILDKIKKIKNVDLIVGGPPCQGFSSLGRGKKKQLKKEEIGLDQKVFIEDPRNQLFKYFLDFVEYYSPKIVLIENVMGVRSAGNYLSLISSSLEKTKPGYYVTGMDINSSEFGVAQSRERLFFVGVRSDIEKADQFIFNLPTILNFNRRSKINVKQAIDDLPKIRSNPKMLNTVLESEIPIGNKGSFGENESTKNYLELINENTFYSSMINKLGEEEINYLPKKLHNHKCRFNNDLDLSIYKEIKPGKYLNHPDNEKVLQKVKYGTEYNESGIRVLNQGFADKYFKLDPDKPARTIVAHLQTDNNGYIHYGDIPRGISPREAARLQSFPDWYVFKGSFTKQYKQIGNAVPPLVAKTFGKIFKSFIEKGSIDKLYKL